MPHTCRQCRHAGQLPRAATKYGPEEVAVLLAKVHCHDHFGMSGDGEQCKLCGLILPPKLRLVFPSLVVTTVPGAFARLTGWYQVTGPAVTALAVSAILFRG